MSRARHHTMKAKGGKAKHRSDGGGDHAEGNPAVFTEAKGKTLGTIGGKDAKPRVDRKAGGRVGGSPYSASSAKSPYTSAHKGGK